MLKTLVRLAIVLAALLVPTAAKADPASIAYFLVAHVGISAAVAVVIAPYLITVATIALNVFGASAARRKARKEAARARSEYNSNLIDRVVTAISPNPPWRVVYGNCVGGGDIVAIFTSDKTGIRPALGTTFTKPDAYKHLVIHVASHEVHAINDVILDGVRLGTTDVDGWVLGTSVGTGSGYTISSNAAIGATSIPVAGGTGTVLVGDEISFEGDSTRYPVVTGITGPAQTIVIASPGLLHAVVSGTAFSLGNEFSKTQKYSHTVTVPASGSLVVSDEVVDIVTAASLVGSDYVDVTVTVSPDRLTIFNANLTDAIVAYTTEDVLSSVRVSKHLGSPTQTVDTFLNGLFPDKWTADHRLQGRAYVVITLDLEETRFQGGPPAMAFDISGKKVYDPRTSTTAFSKNNALIINDFLQSPWGFECDANEIDEAYTIAAANACDTSTVFESLNALGAPVTRTMPLYTCSGAFTTADSPEAILEDLAESMAGFVCYGGQWLIIAGTWTSSVMDLTDDDLDGQISIVQAGAGMDTLFNGAHASYLSFGRTSPSEIVPYQNATFVAADGRELWSNFTLPYTDDEVRARNLVRIFTERSRDGQVIQYPAKLKAWPLRVGDRVRVTSAEYGFVIKYYRLTDWQFGMGTPVNLTLQEDSAGAYDQADAIEVDPAPNTSLPNPHVVPIIAGLTATSGTATLMKLGDGTVVPRVKVSWSAITSPYVIPGGRVEVSWRVFTDDEWHTVVVAGDEVSAFLTDVLDRSILNIRVTVVNSIGARSGDVFISHRVVGKTEKPIDVAGFALMQVVAGIQSIWDANETDLDYGYTEIRTGSVWSTGTVIFQGKADSFLWTAPSTVAVLPTAWLDLPSDWGSWDTWSQTFGSLSYTLMAKHFDTTNNESLTESTVLLDYFPEDTIGESIVNFEARNDRISTPVVTPTIVSDGTALDHTINPNGSADLSLQWVWGGVEAQIDGFEVMVRISATGGVYTIGSAPDEETAFFVNAHKRVAFLMGVNPTSYYSMAVRAYRVVDPDISSDGVLYSAWVSSAGSGEYPYRPDANIAFAGNITGTIDGVPVATVNLAITNFNGRNDRIATAVVAPTIAGDGTAVDHALQDNGSADVSLEWVWGGTEAEIDGFQVMVHGAATGGAYTVGTSPATEVVQELPANKRATILLGVNPTTYLTFAVRAYRVVDTDINAAGVLYSAWVQPAASGENPYRPASSVAFAGDVTGTVAGIAASNVNVWGYISGISVTTPQIALGAATEMYVQSVVSDSHTVDLVTGVQDRVLCTQNYTNASLTDDVDVEISLTSERRLVVSGGYTGSVDAFDFLSVEVNGFLVGPTSSGLNDVNGLTAGQSQRWRESVIWSTTLAPGDDLIAASYCRLLPVSGSGDVTLNSYNVTLRTTVIKR